MYVLTAGKKLKVPFHAVADIFVSFQIRCPLTHIGAEGYFISMCNLVVLQKLISHHQKHLQTTEFSNYDAANIVLKASRP